MAVFIDPQSGTKYEVPDEDNGQATSKYGLMPLEQFEAEQRSGGFGSQVQTAAEEAGRQVLSTGAAAVRGITSLHGEVDAMGNPVTAEEPILDVKGADVAPSLYTPEATERRDVNPIAAGIGAAVPAVVGGALLPGAGVAGVAASLGLDAASGFSQEAVDAELENRDIRGEDVLRNVGLNTAFSLGAMGLGAAARSTLKGGQNLLERAAEGARGMAARRAGAAEGQELAETVAEPTAREELIGALKSRADAAVDKTMTRLEQSTAAKAANNPNAQRDALEALNDSFVKSDPTMVSELRQFEKGPPNARLEGLRQARVQLSDDSDLGRALDNLIGREDLWGSEALGSAAKLDAAMKLRPPPGASPDELLQFAAAVREARGGEFAGMADQIEQLAERHHEINVASALGDVVPEAGTKGIDYTKAMKTLDPEEAWRLTKDGADDGLRKLEANTVSDAFQRVDDTLKEDVAMSVKRQDFVAGADKWSPAQIGKQDEWLGSVSEAPEDALREFTGETLAPKSPVSLEGKSLEDLRALELGADDRPKTMAGLRGSEEFAESGRVPKHIDRQGHEQGITIVKSADGTGDGVYLRDGRHRFSVAKEKGLKSVYGTVLDDEGNILFRGDIPLKSPVGKPGSGMLGKAEELLSFLGKSKGSNPESGYALGGFATDGERALNQGITRLKNAADPVTRNFEADQLKRNLDGITKRLGKATQGVDQSAKAAGVAKLLEFTDELRSGLESAELFGRNAGLQTETNAAWKKLIDPYTRIQKKMSDFLGREFGNVGAESGNIIRYNPDQVERAMGAFDRNFRKDLGDAIGGIDKMMSARQQSGLSHLDQLAAARADLQRISDGFEFSDLLRVAKAKAREPALATVAKRALGSGSGAVTGAIAAGLPGAVAGAGIGVAAERGMAAALDKVNLLKPGSESAFSGALRKHLGLARTEQAGLLGDEAFAGTLSPSLRKAAFAVGEGSNAKAVELATMTAKAGQRDRQLTARLMVDPEAARKFIRMAGDVAPAIMRFQGEHETTQQAFQAYRQMLDGFGRDPNTMLEMLHEEFGDVSTMSPKLQREMVVQATKVVNYLQAYMPGKRNVSVVYPNGTPASSMEIRQFALRFTAATDPASVSADARAGRLQRVQVDTLQALWPRDYDGLKAETLQALGTGKVSTVSRQRLSLLFDFGSAVDPALGSRTRAIVVAARASQEHQGSAPAGASPSASTSKATSAANTPAGIGALQLGQQLTF